ncbi:membrane protein insertase YidC [Helicobacter sp. 13S00401-1]|uniref:membrane protein insertase YidC n=1 Tax=Helicobacter sp. 13S00401-1 TaxID=1905758 RepID=UPI000BA71CD9|nr:membrane protein insertase YidC [Helicobacter sp. 13S00401-1]PAF51451.1 membrane protein insertase YidC [Helicobacter sp. 13S00401-1]
MNKSSKSPNLRIVIAIAAALVVIVIWSKYFAPDETNTHHTSTNTTKDAKLASAETKESTSINSAPAIAKQTDALKNNTKSVPNLAKDSPDSTLLTIKSKEFDMDIDSLGRIKQVYLKDPKFTHPPQEHFLEHVKRLVGIVKGEQKQLDRLPIFANDASPKPLEVRFANEDLNALAFKTPYKLETSSEALKERILNLGKTPVSIVLTQTLGKLEITKTLLINPNLTYTVTIHTSEPVKYLLSNGARPTADGENYAFNGVLLEKASGSIEKIEDGDAKKEGEAYPNSTFVASVDRYYTTLLYSKNNLDVIVGQQATGKKLPMSFIDVQKQDVTFSGYIGPKYYSTLHSIDPKLTNVIEYGMITFFAKYVFWLLNFLHGYVGNWGFAIILVTLIIRIILFPLTYKGMVGMQKLKELAPKMKELQAKHKGEPQKLQAAMMELYKKNGANPVGGCLPLVLQIPVFFGIYRVLYNAVELKSASFIFWIHDLSVMDPYFVLPIIMGLSMYLQQTLSPTPVTDPTQAKIFKLLPVVFTIFLITFPAGLVLYWTVNNIFSALQQLAINKILAAKKAKFALKHGEKEVIKEEKKHK